MRSLEEIDVETDEDNREIAEAASERIAVAEVRPSETRDHRPNRTYLVLPSIFLMATLLGGLRLGATDSALIFLKPALVCLVFSAMSMALFFRSGLISLEGWFSEDISMLHNAANAGVLLTLFAATTQLFNSLLPEQGLTFWVVGFCFSGQFGTTFLPISTPKNSWEV